MKLWRLQKLGILVLEAEAGYFWRYQPIMPDQFAMLKSSYMWNFGPPQILLVPVTVSCVRFIIELKQERVEKST
jgi:hypothetical protein